MDDESAKRPQTVNSKIKVRTGKTEKKTTQRKKKFFNDKSAKNANVENGRIFRTFIVHPEPLPTDVPAAIIEKHFFALRKKSDPDDRGGI